MYFLLYQEITVSFFQIYFYYYINLTKCILFRATQVAYQYYLTVSPADGHLYVSDPEKHQILKVISLEPVSDPSNNCEPVRSS